MGEVVIHAGMAKAGSTTIQRWLADHIEVLRERDVHVLVTHVDPDDPKRRLVLRHADARSVNSGVLLARYRLSDRAPSELANFFSQLSDYASQCPVVVVSSESLAELLCEPDLAFLYALDQLGRSHRVRVAYYVRPQHTAFEALWRHFGFREDVEPVRYLEQCTARLDSQRTTQMVHQGAPSVRFEVRPVRADLLDGSNAAYDFASNFIGTPDLLARPDRDRWDNRGLPLELANALRFSPNGYFWNRPGYVFTRRNDAFQRMQRLFGDLQLPEDERVHRSRLILQAHCHEQYEPGNAKLIAAFGWSTEWFVPPVRQNLGRWTIDELNDLWQPGASANELMVLFHALRAAIGDGPTADR
jgi:hypothetical protein